MLVDKCSLLPYKVKLIPNCKFLCSTHMCKDLIVGKIVQIQPLYTATSYLDISILKALCQYISNNSLLYLTPDSVR